jgi:hypothetical protein
MSKNPSKGYEPGNVMPVPRRLGGGHPLGWWRTMRPDLFGEAECLLVGSALDGLAVLGAGKDFGAALKGDAAAAISAALSLVPVREVTLKVDITMTALLSCALKNDPAAVLVLSHILGVAQWGDKDAEDLGLAWLDRHMAHPMDPKRFASSEAALAAAFSRQE